MNRQTEYMNLPIAPVYCFICLFLSLIPLTDINLQSFLYDEKCAMVLDRPVRMDQSEGVVPNEMRKGFVDFHECEVLADTKMAATTEL